MTSDEFEDGEGLVLIPQPQSVIRSGLQVPIGGVAVTELPDELAAYRSKVFELADTVSGPADCPVLPVRFTVFEGRPEEYKLGVDRSAVRIEASDGLAALHAMRTLVDLWDSTGGSALPAVEIADGPTFAARGVFIESYAGADHMSLADWHQLTDRLGQLKFNTVGVSLYGCWDMHHGERSEWLFAPLHDFPQLRSPQRMVTWDPATEREIEYRYLPKMFEQDFFGAVARYAARQGIEVLPHLGGPGHSTLIPRCLPELSALDDKGNPAGYGYCVSRDCAKETLTRLVRSLARQHLAPNGIRRLHVAADEYYPIRNVDPTDRKRVVSPYCRCARCRDFNAGQMLMEYLVLVGQVLAEEGITMVHWHDSLVREGVLDEYLDRLEAMGVPQPTIAWWKYNDPVPRPKAGRTETWSCPTVGLTSFLFQQECWPNIETTLWRGRDEGTTGAFAYTLIDPADHLNYAFLADFSWNCDSSSGAAGFRRRWARYLCPDDTESAQQALSVASTVTACYPLMMYVVNHVLPFFATASADATADPDDVLRSFSVTQPAVGEVLRQVVDTMRDAVSLMPEGRDVRHWTNPTAVWRNEATRLADTLDLFLGVLAAARQPEAPTESQIALLADQATELLRLAARSKAPYVAPMTLREHWGFVREIEPVVKRLRESEGLRPAESWYAWMI